MDISEGIKEEDKQALLEKVDGTNFREYKGEKVTMFFFGSDVDDGEYPYYLFSYQDIIDNEESASYMGDLFYFF